MATAKSYAKFKKTTLESSEELQSLLASKGDDNLPTIDNLHRIVVTINDKVMPSIIASAITDLIVYNSANSEGGLKSAILLVAGLTNEEGTVNVKQDDDVISENLPKSKVKELAEATVMAWGILAKLPRYNKVNVVRYPKQGATGNTSTGREVEIGW